MLKANRLFQMATIASICVFSSAAYAGFEWTPPARTNATVSKTPPVVAAPREQVEKEMLVLEKAESKAASVSVVEEMAPDNRHFESVDGFGKDIALVFALRQIVPHEYAFSFEATVDQAQRVDWNGGKPWNIVLKDMLNPVGLDVTVVDQTVWIRSFSLESAPVMFEEQASSHNIEPVDVMGQKEEIVEPAPVKHKAEMMMESVMLQEKKAVPAYDYSGVDYNPSYPRRSRPDISREGMVNNDATAIPVAMVKATPPESLINDSKMMNEYEPASHGHPEALRMGKSRAGVMGQSDPYEISFWQAEQGDSLRETLMVWSARSGIEMLWGASYDYRLPTAISMHGTFPDAVKSVLTMYETANDKPMGRLHLNMQDGPSVLIIESGTETITQ